MRILHSADLHLGDTSYGRWKDQLDDASAALQQFVALAQELEVDAAVLAGDTWDTRRPSPQELHPFAQAAHQLRGSRIPLLVGAGNHDGPGEIGYAQTKTAGWLSELGVPGLYAFPDPTVAIVPTKSGDLAVVSLPYPHKRSFDERPGTLQEKQAAVSAAMEAAIREGWEESKRTGLLQLFIGHLSVLNAQLGAEQAMKMGWDVTVDPGVFDGYSYSALGHIHRQQVIAPSVAYSGSMTYSDFGEATQEKVFLEVEFTCPPTITKHPTGCRQMFSFDVTETTDGWQWEIDDNLLGAVVQLRFLPLGRNVPAEVRKNITDDVRDHGAFWIRSVVVRPKALPRIPAVIDPTLTMADQIGRYLAVKEMPAEPYTSSALSLIADVDRL